MHEILKEEKNHTFWCASDSLMVLRINIKQRLNLRNWNQVIAYSNIRTINKFVVAIPMSLFIKAKPGWCRVHIEKNTGKNFTINTWWKCIFKNCWWLTKNDKTYNTQVFVSSEDHLHMFPFQSLPLFLVINPTKEHPVKALKQEFQSLVLKPNHVWINWQTIWAIKEACSLEWPKGSICQAILGRPHSPKVSFKKLFDTIAKFV